MVVSEIWLLTTSGRPSVRRHAARPWRFTSAWPAGSGMSIHGRRLTERPGYGPPHAVKPERRVSTITPTRKMCLACGYRAGCAGVSFRKTYFVFALASMNSKSGSHTLCYAILRLGRKSGFRAEFRPDSNQENLKIGPQASLRPAGEPIFEAFPTRTRNANPRRAAFGLATPKPEMSASRDKHCFDGRPT